MLDIVQEYLARTGKTMVVVHGWDLDEDDIRAIKNLFEDEREEKKMLNFDKYREEVEKRAAWAVREGSKNPKPAHLVLNEIIIGKGLPYMKGNELVDWLFEEYEPPLLENGDGLKPGDWIMVRDLDNQNWAKRQFVCYYNGQFWCLDDGKKMEDGDYEDPVVFTWNQARLPEDGE